MLGLGDMAELAGHVPKADDRIVLLVDDWVNGESLLIREEKHMVAMMLEVIKKVPTMLHTELSMLLSHKRSLHIPLRFAPSGLDCIGHSGESHRLLLCELSHGHGWVGLKHTFGSLRC